VFQQVQLGVKWQDLQLQLPLVCPTHGSAHLQARRYALQWSCTLSARLSSRESVLQQHHMHMAWLTHEAAFLRIRCSTPPTLDFCVLDTRAPSSWVSKNNLLAPTPLDLSVGGPAAIPRTGGARPLAVCSPRPQPFLTLERVVTAPHDQEGPGRPRQRCALPSL
jgi:hypothetical protein